MPAPRPCNGNRTALQNLDVASLVSENQRRREAPERSAHHQCPTHAGFSSSRFSRTPRPVAPCWQQPSPPPSKTATRDDGRRTELVRPLTVRPNMTVSEAVATVREHAPGSLQGLGGQCTAVPQ